MNIKKKFIVLFLLVLLNACVGSSTRGVFGTGVSIALDPRTLGTQIDDSIMQKNLSAKLINLNTNYLLSVKPKVLDGRIFITGKVDSIEEITPALFSEDENVNSFNQKDNIKEEPKLFEEDNKHDDFEIPAFLRKQKN